jgi:hypothetical protein
MTRLENKVRGASDQNILTRHQLCGKLVLVANEIDMGKLLDDEWVLVFERITPCIKSRNDTVSNVSRIPS